MRYRPRSWVESYPLPLCDWMVYGLVSESIWYTPRSGSGRCTEHCRRMSIFWFIQKTDKNRRRVEGNGLYLRCTEYSEDDCTLSTLSRDAHARLPLDDQWSYPRSEYRTYARLYPHGYHRVWSDAIDPEDARNTPKDIHPSRSPLDRTTWNTRRYLFTEVSLERLIGTDQWENRYETLYRKPVYPGHLISRRRICAYILPHVSWGQLWIPRLYHWITSNSRICETDHHWYCSELYTYYRRDMEKIAQFAHIK